MKNLPLHVKIIFGLIAGIIWAFVSSHMGWNQFTIDWIDPFGKIFIRLLKFIAVPLVLFSIIAGVAGLSDISKLGRLGAKTLGIYLITTVIAVGIGLLLVNLVKPGTFTSENQRIKNRIIYEQWVQSTPDVPQPKDGRHFLTDAEYKDIVQEVISDSLAYEENAAVQEKLETAKQAKDKGPLSFLVEIVPENIILAISDNGLMLQVIFFAIFFGLTLAMIPGDTAKPVIDFINGLNEAFLKMVDLIMQIAPFFVFALLAGVIAKMANTPSEVIEIFKSLGTYSITLVVGLAFMVFVLFW